MRFGLVGTGPWAHLTHGPGLVDAPDVELVGVWGRSPEKAGKLADELDTTAYEDLDKLLDDVDAVAFAVPPDIQADLALRAAGAGKHLLLDKPIATSSAAARELADEAGANSCAAVVLFTDRFLDGGAAWLAEVGDQEWQGGSMVWLGALDSPDSPYRESQWRRERGALWDIGPHALSTLIGALGPVADIRAVAGRGDVAHLVTTHDSGAS
jgi:predicted dehydrogenase